MYESFYHLQINPFSLTPDPKFCFSHSGYKQAREYLEYALKLGEGLVMVTGRPGTGKTTLVESFLATLNRGTVNAVRIAVSNLNSEDLLRAVAYAYDIEAGGHDKATLRHLIKCYLVKQLQYGRRALLVIDEAQGLPRSALDELRLLADLQAESHQMLQLFLVGQEQLQEQLSVPEMDHIQQRVIANYHLVPLDLMETRSYVDYRLRRAGWQGDPELTGAAVLDIYRFSRGVPRHINKLCNRLLLLGYGIGSHKLDREEVQVITEEMDAEQLRPIFIEQSVNEDETETLDIPENQPGSLSKLAIRVAEHTHTGTGPAMSSASAVVDKARPSDRSTGQRDAGSPGPTAIPGPTHAALRKPLHIWAKELRGMSKWQYKVVPSLMLLTVALLSISAVTGIFENEASHRWVMQTGEPVSTDSVQAIVKPDDTLLQRVLDDELPGPAAGILLASTPVVLAPGKLPDSPLAEVQTFISREAEIDYLLVQGHQALGDNRLLTPALDSAYYYFQSTLRLAPENAEAVAGIEKIMERYVWLTNRALDQQDRIMAGRYIARGLSLQPDNGDLLALKKGLREPIISQGTEEDEALSTRGAGQKVGKFFSRVKAFFVSSNQARPDARASYQMTSSFVYE